jgi:pentatricopeptide repeat protein
MEGGEGFDVATRVYLDLLELHKPDRITLTAMIEVCTAAGRWDDALGYYQKLKELGLRPDAKLWMTLLAALSRGCQWDLIDHIWNALEVRECASASSNIPGVLVWGAG